MDRRRIRIAQGILFAAVGLLTTACFERSLRPVNPCTRANVGETIRVQSVDEVDLLFMIDNSNSMAEEQASLTLELPRMVRVLASGDSSNPPDGMREFEPVRSMHIGIITSDMGTGSHMVPTCDRGTFGTRFGDDGILITRGRTAISGCMATYPAIFDFVRGADPDVFSQDVACVANTGTGGCGFEQQLEAVLKAISPSAPTSYTVPGYTPPIFHESSLGHADRENAGFIRDNSALAVIMFTDEEDCSAANPDIFNPSSPTYGGTDLNLRCFTYPETQHPIERYVSGPGGTSGLMGLRQNPALLIFAAIAGVPVEAVGATGTDYEAMLAHPLMQEEVDTTMPTRLRPSCNVPGRGIAFPPRRIVRTAQGLQLAGASTTVQSICQESYSGALDTIIEKIADALGGACLPRDLNPDAEGFVGCQVFEILPTTGDTTSCAGLAGRDATTEQTVMIDGVAHQMCEVIQVGPNGSIAGEQGWFYETTEQMIPGSDLGTLCGPDSQRIKFTFSPITNSDIRLECLQTVAPETGSVVQIGTFCDPAPGGVNMCPTGLAPAGSSFPLACDPGVRSCALPCTETSNCTEGGLLGDVCDTRSWEEVVGGDPRQIEQLTAAGVDISAPHNFCVNPTCI